MGFEERFTFGFVLPKAHGPVYKQRVIGWILDLGVKLQRVVNRSVDIARAGTCRDQQTQADEHYPA